VACSRCCPSPALVGQIMVPVELVRAMLDSGHEVVPGGETRVLTVLFTDIANFTMIAEILPPEQLSRELGSYFDVLEGAINEAGGLVDKFMGVCAMAFFNALPCCRGTPRMPARLL
jgi:adenylate cyclase